MSDALKVLDAGCTVNAMPAGCGTPARFRRFSTATARRTSRSRVPSDGLSAAVRHGSRVVELTGAVQEKAFIRELQWDVYGLEMLHVDFARVSEHERIQSARASRAARPGHRREGRRRDRASAARAGNRVRGFEDSREDRSRRSAELDLDGAIHAGELKLPPGVELLADPDRSVVQCVLPHGRAGSDGQRQPGAAEPEVIGRKAEDEEAGEE